MKIEQYAIIGDMHTVALVGSNGSIDWLCLPKLGSDACFAALLGIDANGYWRISASDPTPAVKRSYQKVGHAWVAIEAGYPGIR